MAEKHSTPPARSQQKGSFGETGRGACRRLGWTSSATKAPARGRLLLPSESA
jgi:hypothetical protein